LEVTSEYLIVYQNTGGEEHEVFKKDEPSIIAGRENALAITPIVFTEIKRECGESPTKRFCTITEYRKLGKELNDVPEELYKTKAITSPEDTCIIMVPEPGKDKQNYFICSDDKLELERINFAMSLVASSTPVKKQKNLLKYYTGGIFINTMVEVNDEEVKIYKCEVGDNAAGCLDDGSE